MHELSVAQSIIDTVLIEAEKHEAKEVKEINVEVGELMQIEIAVLLDAFKMLTKDSTLEQAQFLVHVNEASFSCRRCNAGWSFRDVRKELEQVPDSLRIREPDSLELPIHFLPYLYSSFIHCPECGSSDTVASDGAEDIRLRRLVME